MRVLPQENCRKMNWPWPFDIAFLGAGGNDPRIDTLSVDSGETRRLLELPPMHSAYAIDIDEDGMLAAGTKAGLVYIVSSTGRQKTDEPVPIRQLAQGAPVLSVCWANKSILAVSDTARRCLIWNTNREAPPRPLDTKGETICSLLKLAGLLAGLSSGGKLLFWEPWQGRLVRTIDVPLPPAVSALVHMVYWPVENALACPSRIGHLTLFGLEKEDLRDLEAHEGGFYAISVWGERLLTVGIEDGRMKVWEAGSDRPALEFKVAEGVISAAAFNDQRAKVLLVEAQGRANFYTAEEDKLRLIGPIAGEDYRTAVVPASERIQALYAQRREEEVRRTVSEIRGGIGRVPDDVIDRLHSRLTDLGYKQVSLALRAERAAQSGNIVGALRFCSSLMQILPQDNAKVSASMERYASLLEKAWHMPEADTVCKHILDIDPNYRFVVEASNLSEMAKLVREADYVIKPDLPIEQVIESATVIRKRFAGRYVINSLGPESCGRVRISPEAIEEKYERVRRESEALNLPVAIAEQIWWLSREGHDRTQFVTLGDGASNSMRGLQFALQVSCGELDTVVTPVVLFDWRHVSPDESVEEGNERASCALRRIGDKALSNAYLAAVHGALRLALRRLVSEKRPQRGIQ
jgi:hypothetical protein